MRICILTQTFPQFKGDSAAPFMAGLAQGMADSGNQVFVLTPFSQKLKLKNRGSYKIIPYKYIFPSFLHRIGYSRTLTNDLHIKPIIYFLTPMMLFFAMVSLFRLIKKEKIDIINAHWILPNGFIGAVISVFTGTPVVPTLPGSDVLMARKNYLFKSMAKLAANCATGITSNSADLLKDLSKIGIKKKRQKVIIYGVDPKEFKPQLKNIPKLKKQLRIDPNYLVVVGVGRLVEKKGFRYLIEAIPKIASNYKKVCFVIVGDGAEKEMLQNIAEKLNVSKYCRFTGMIDYKKLLDYYNLGDIFILPSVRDREGNIDDQSVSVVEAMACGKPIITTNFSGYKIVVKEGENGFLTDEKNTDQIAKAINKLIRNPSLREKMGQKSRQLVLEKFSWKAIGREYTNFFNEILLNKH